MSVQSTQLRLASPGISSQVFSKIGDDIVNFFGKAFKSPIISSTGQPTTRTGITQVLRDAKSSAFTRIQRQPFTGRGKIEDVIDIPNGSTIPRVSTGTKVTVATVGASLAATTGILSLTEGGQNIVNRTGEGISDITGVLKPLAEGSKSVIDTFGSSPLLIGGLIILGGILLIKK